VLNGVEIDLRRIWIGLLSLNAGLKRQHLQRPQELPSSNYRTKFSRQRLASVMKRMGKFQNVTLPLVCIIA